MPKQKYTQSDVILLALIAYRYDEISIGKCMEITGMSRVDIIDEMEARVGKKDARP